MCAIPFENLDVLLGRPIGLEPADLERKLVADRPGLNIRDESHRLTRFFYRAFGMWQRFGPNRLWRWLAKDRQALAASIERIFTWDIRRVVMAHGDPVEIDDPVTLRAAFAPLLARSPTTAKG